MRNPINATAVLFNGAADGQWTLPVELDDARNHILRVQSLLDDDAAPEHPLNVRSTLAAEVAGGGDVDLSTLVDAETAMRAHTERRAILQEALQLAEDRFGTALRDHARMVITDHLAPAFDKLTKSLMRDFKLTSHIGSDTPPSVVLSQDKPVRDALIRIDGNEGRYSVIKDAHALVYRLCETESKDHAGAFASIKNAEHVWPDLSRTGMRPTNPPWPRDNTRDFLQWVANNDGQLWIPTPEQQTARWVEVFGDRVERAAAMNANMRAWAGQVA